jgi:HEAT repeat protein
MGPFGVGVPITEMLMKDKESSGKTAAVLLLATDTTEASKQAIGAALSDKNWTVRAAAARAVGSRGIQTFFDDVVSIFEDKREEARYSAAATVIRLKQPAPRPQPARKSAPKP